MVTCHDRITAQVPLNSPQNHARGPSYIMISGRLVAVGVYRAVQITHQLSVSAFACSAPFPCLRHFISRLCRRQARTLVFNGVLSIALPTTCGEDCAKENANCGGTCFHVDVALCPGAEGLPYTCVGCAPLSKCGKRRFDISNRDRRELFVSCPA